MKKPTTTGPKVWDYGSIPAEVFESNLSTHAKILVGAIRYHSFDGEPCYPGLRRLQNMCSCSRPTIINAIEELEKEGWLRVIREKNVVNHYQFISKISGQAGLPGGKETSVSGQIQLEKHQKVVNELYPNEVKTNDVKSTNTVVTLPKKTTPQGEFVDWFKVEYERTHGKPYIDSKGDYRQAAQLLKVFKPETLQAMVPGAWGHKDAYVQKISKTVKGFCSIVNQLSLPKANTHNKWVNAGKAVTG